MRELDTTRVVKSLIACASVDALSRTFAETIAPLGMTASASGMVSGARAVSDNPFHFTTWPAAWLEVYVARGYRAIDPIPRWAMVSGQAISWTDVVKAFPSNDRGLDVQRAALTFGFHEGYITPVRTGDGALGLVSVGGGRRTPFELSETLFLQSVSTAVLLKADTLMARPPARREDFTLRERECIGFLRQGFTDAEIGKVLGIAVTTVRSHIDNARRKVGARNRVELATY